ncbi:Lipopolysaccharide export system permease protein lptG [Serratia proteamaculans]|uniref:LPS export ABC transporter permease LptG n=1 Tax=Serratia proteamaculans TaxID=28151 RepID=UPI00124ACB0A|nr:LPS export ABC transporter permease LptG [Serratia proteamaculans]KAB1499182.1 LPS export ABC transporter permease LptG [Serratia proteamaculans]CAI0730745.1 Lipopolysaccharide export system permease protein lptG [Serratia proteamaculans]CAI0840414.1 Lipopolysaccharide export system permease protein lptG [Serratia proteamaculans]
MNIFSRYLIRNLFIGFAAAAGLLIPLFTTFNLINELEDVTPNGYHWTQALLVVLMTLPRSLVDLGPFIALLGGIVGLGQLSKTLELTAMRTAGFSIFRIALVTLYTGLFINLSLGALDEWVASPMQQQAQELKETALAKTNKGADSGNALWARSGNEFVTVKSLDKQNQPVGIEIFRYKSDLALESYVYAEKATTANNGLWTLHQVMQKQWKNKKEVVQTYDNLPWQSLFSGMNLKSLTLPADNFSIKQLKQYIHYLQSSEQPSNEYQIALWQKLGRPILVLAMILLAIPFTFSIPRAPGMGSRLAIGVIVGLLTYIIYQIMLNLGLLFSFNVQLTTLAPPILLLMLSLALVHRFNKQH